MAKSIKLKNGIYWDINGITDNPAKTIYKNLGATVGTVFDTGIPTNIPNGFAGLIIFMKGNDISLIPFGRRWWTSANSHSALLTTNTDLVGENTTTWTLTLTTTSTNGEKLLIIYY